MEKKEYELDLEKGESEFLIFNLGDNLLFKIDLNSDDQKNLRNLFFQIINLTFECIPQFVLSKQAKSYDDKLYVEIASEFINDLNAEILKIIELQSNSIKN